VAGGVVSGDDVVAVGDVSGATGTFGSVATTSDVVAGGVVSGDDVVAVGDVSGETGTFGSLGVTGDATVVGRVVGVDGTRRNIREMGAPPYVVVDADVNSLLLGEGADEFTLPPSGAVFTLGSYLEVVARGAALDTLVSGPVTLIGNGAIADGSSALFVLIDTDTWQRMS
jgi:hypothetical protein